MRDLHDDVGAKLLHILHKAHTPDMVHLANGALTSLQEIVHDLGDHPACLLDHTLADWRAELQERIADAGAQLDWKQSTDTTYELNPTIRSHLARTVREIVSNSLRHGAPSEIAITIDVSRGSLSLRIEDDGKGRHPDSWATGNGIASTRARIAALHGDISWSSGPSRTGIAVEVRVPLENAQ
jgi:signal transduction histidine kinase